MNKSYSLGRAVLDLFLICITGGLWLVYLIVKYLRTH
jgi:hypothetical protein